MGGVYIHDAAPNRKLAGALDLVAPLIACGGKSHCQVGDRQGQPSFEPKGPALQHVGRQGVAGRGVDTGDHDLPFARRHAGEDAQPHLFIVPRGGFHPPQGKLPGGKEKGLVSQGLHVLAQPVPLRLIRNQYEHPPV